MAGLNEKVELVLAQSTLETIGVTYILLVSLVLSIK